MSKRKPIKPAGTAKTNTTPSRSATATSAARRAPKKEPLYTSDDMIFGRENYLLMAAGLVLIAIGFVLMGGGAMPDANTWEPSVIYSFRRTVLSVVVILAGLILEIVAIFRNTSVVEAIPEPTEAQ